MSQTPMPNENAPISSTIMEILREELPPFFTRDEAAEKLNGIFTKETLANYAHTGKGPKLHTMGRRVFYVREEFLDWLESYLGGMYVEFDGFSRRVRQREDAPTGTGEGS